MVGAQRTQNEVQTKYTIWTCMQKPALTSIYMYV